MAKKIVINTLEEFLHMNDKPTKVKSNTIHKRFMIMLAALPAELQSMRDFLVNLRLTDIDIKNMNSQTELIKNVDINGQEYVQKVLELATTHSNDIIAYNKYVEDIYNMSESQLTNHYNQILGISNNLSRGGGSGSWTPISPSHGSSGTWDNITKGDTTKDWIMDRLGIPGDTVDGLGERLGNKIMEGMAHGFHEHFLEPIRQFAVALCQNLDATVIIGGLLACMVGLVLKFSDKSNEELGNKIISRSIVISIMLKFLFYFLLKILGA